MPDRRQGDRRESGQGFANKKIKISLITLIFIIIFVILIIASVISCVVVARNNYHNGYNQGIKDYRDGKIEDEVYEYDTNELIFDEYEDVQ